MVVLANPADGSVDVLVKLLQAAHLESTPDGCTPDDTLSTDIISRSYSNFSKDVSSLVQRATDLEMAEIMLRMMFNRLVAAIRAPYVRKLDLEKTSHMEHLLSHGKAVSDLTNLHNEKMSDLTQQHNETISDLKRQHNERISDLTRQSNEKISDLTAQHNSQSQKQFIDDAAKMQEISQEHSSQILELVKGHNAKDMAVTQELSKLCNTNGDLMRDKQVLLRQKAALQQDAGIPATVTHTVTWDRVVLENQGCQDLELPLPDRCLPESTFARVVNAVYSSESDTYPSLQATLSRYLTEPRTRATVGTTVWATHTKASAGLDGRKPDFTVSVGGITSLDVHSVVMLWEAKAVKADLDSDGRGQLYSYLKLLSEKQSQRNAFVGVLSNLRQNVVMTLLKQAVTSPPNSFKYICKTYRSVGIGAVLSYLRHSVLHNDIYRPCLTNFSHDLGDIVARLGNPMLSVVAEFNLPSSPHPTTFRTNRWINADFQAATANTKTMVVKRTLPVRQDRPARPVKNEIEILRLIHGIENVPNTLPTLLFHSNSFDEFGISPCGYCLKPGEQMMKWDVILCNILDALEWLHGHNIIHRDVRWDNVIWDLDHAVLIDLGSAAHVDPADRDEPKFMYRGGYLCCPRDLIGNFDDEYTPLPAHDCAAFLLMVNMLMWPSSWTNLASHRIAEYDSYEAGRMMRFWDGMKTSKTWGRYEKAASEAKYEILREVTEWCVYW